MSRIAIELESTQLEKALTHLNAAERFRLAKRLAAQSFDEVVMKLRRTARRKGLSPRMIQQLAEQARQEFHYRRHH